MDPLPPRTFCHCIPVRFGVLVMSMLGCIGGSIMSGYGWDSTVHKGKKRLILLSSYRVLIVFVDETYLTANQEVSVAMASFSYTLFAAISLLGCVRFVPSNSVLHERSHSPQSDWNCHKTSFFRFFLQHGPVVALSAQRYVWRVLHLHALPQSWRS